MLFCKGNAPAYYKTTQDESQHRAQYFNMQKYYSALESATKQVIDANVHLEFERERIAARLQK